MTCLIALKDLNLSHLVTVAVFIYIYINPLYITQRAKEAGNTVFTTVLSTLHMRKQKWQLLAQSYTASLTNLVFYFKKGANWLQWHFCWCEEVLSGIFIAFFIIFLSKKNLLEIRRIESVFSDAANFFSPLIYYGFPYSSPWPAGHMLMAPYSIVLEYFFAFSKPFW